MMGSMRTTTLLLLLPILAAVAQDETAEEEQEIRRYTVEMIIFKYAQDVSTGSEIFPGDEPVYEELPDESIEAVVVLGQFLARIDCPGCVGV